MTGVLIMNRIMYWEPMQAGQLAQVYISHCHHYISVLNLASPHSQSGFARTGNKDSASHWHVCMTLKKRMAKKWFFIYRNDDVICMCTNFNPSYTLCLEVHVCRFIYLLNIVLPLTHWLPWAPFGALKSRIYFWFVAVCFSTSLRIIYYSESSTIVC